MIAHVNNPPGYPGLEIQLYNDDEAFPVDGSLSVTKRSVAGNLTPAEIHQTLKFRRTINSGEARLMADWFHLAAKIADRLDTLILTQEDLNQSIQARIVGGLIEIYLG